MQQDITHGPQAHSLAVLRDHSRRFDENLYVYAVVSRRSKGVSIGVNLNPDKVCNFDCVYCQVDRNTPGLTREVDLVRLWSELEDTLDRVLSGRLFEEERFRETPMHFRRLNDIAFSGDGEPTACPLFGQAVHVAAQIRQQKRLADVKLVLISNASLFHRPGVQEGMRTLLANNGEIWGKLDAGTEAYYELINRSAIPFRRILDNLALAARMAPLVIQAMVLRLHGEPPDESEIDALCSRLLEIVRSGGQIKLVQVYTVARNPAEVYATPLRAGEVDAIARRVRELTGLAAEAYPGLVS